MALEAAMKVFWAEGFDGASVDTLSRKALMPRATLYQLYGDKEGLFLAAIDHYAKTRAARVAVALGPQKALKDDLAAFFAAVIDLALSEPAARGCLIACVLADVAGTNERFRSELEQRFLTLETRIRDRLAADKSQHGDIAARALMVACISRGLMLRARAGADRNLLEKAAAEAVSMFAAH